DSLGEGPRGFDKLRVIQECERLQRSVGARASHDAVLTGGRVEDEHVWRRTLAFPVDVEAAAILGVAGVRHIFLRIVVRDHLPKSGRLPGLDALPTFFL